MEPLRYRVPVDERGGFTIEVLQPPLPPPLIDELLELWSHAEIFGHAPDDGEGGVRAVLSGHEAADNRDVLYVARVDGALAGTTKLCVSTDPHPWFGGLGEVSTLPEFRRRGIAEALCTRAREDFISVGGKMLVLGTVNPLAARRYFAIGYRRMPGAHDRLLAFFPRWAALSHRISGGCVAGTNCWWNNCEDERSAEEWAMDLFRGVQAEPLSVSVGTAAARIPMISLIYFPNDLAVLDANTRQPPPPLTPRSPALSRLKALTLGRLLRRALLHAQRGPGVCHGPLPPLRRALRARLGRLQPRPRLTRGLVDAHDLQRDPCRALLRRCAGGW